MLGERRRRKLEIIRLAEWLRLLIRFGAYILYIFYKERVIIQFKREITIS